MPTTSGDAAEGSALARVPTAAQKSLLAPTLFTLFGLALLLSLGTWQVKRLAWKEGLIAERSAAVAAAPVDLPRTLEEARALEFHRVRAEGTFRNDRELYLHAMTAEGTAGYHVITPLVLARGGTLLVDRGFVPEERKATGTREAGNPAGPQQVVGLLRLSQAGKSSWFVPDNLPAKGEWFSLDLDAMAQAAAIANPLPFTIDADATPNPGGYPVGGQTPLDLPNNHLQYAITWYLMAVALVVVYLRLVLRRGGRHA
jgi:surfeit locus 1 family protein